MQTLGEHSYTPVTNDRLNLFCPSLYCLIIKIVCTSKVLVDHSHTANVQTVNNTVRFDAVANYYYKPKLIHCLLFEFENVERKNKINNTTFVRWKQK